MKIYFNDLYPRKISEIFVRSFKFFTRYYYIDGLSGKITSARHSIFRHVEAKSKVGISIKTAGNCYRSSVSKNENSKNNPKLLKNKEIIGLIYYLCALNNRVYIESFFAMPCSAVVWRVFSSSKSTSK